MVSISLTAQDSEVYPPCVDSFALADALDASASSFLHSAPPQTCVEIGCGSGYVSAALCSCLSRHSISPQIILTDISPAAAESSRKTLSAHGFQADIVVTDLLRGLEGRLRGSVDLLICNPPYVVTPDAEVGRGGISAAWAGGSRGRRVIDRILEIACGIMSAGGTFLLVTVMENDPREIQGLMEGRGFCSDAVIERKTEEETLVVLRFWRPDGGFSGKKM